MKKLLTLGSLVSVTAVVATVSCGATQAKEVTTSPIEVKHSFDFLSQDKIHFEDTLKTSDMKRDINITNINNYEDNNKIIINELVTNSTKSGPGAFTSVKGALFKYGTKSDLLLASGNNGFAEPEKITSMSDANSYDYISNISGQSLSEGGNIEMELTMKNGVIYNVPGNGLLPNKENGKDLLAEYTRYRPLVYVDKNYVPHVISQVDSTKIASLSLKVGDQSLSAIERKGNDIKDAEFGDGVDRTTAAGVAVKGEAAYALRPSVQEKLKAIDSVIYDTYFTSELKTLDLTGLNAYEVVADGSNGETEFKQGLLQIPTILQAPYKGKVSKIVSNAKSYTTKPGISLVITKKDKPLKLNDKVETKYEINPKYSFLDDAKWASTSIPYASTNWIEPKFANELGTHVYKQGGWKDPMKEVVAGGNYIIKNGNAYTFTPVNSKGIGEHLNRTLFVINTKKQMYGTITICGTNGSSAMDTNLIPAYLMSLGIDEAVHFDGGGSSYSYERMSSDKYSIFQKSIDSRGWRSLLTSFAIGGSDD